MASTMFLSARKSSDFTKCNTSPFCTYAALRLIQSLLGRSPINLTKNFLMRQDLCVTTINAKLVPARGQLIIIIFLQFSDFSSTGIYFFKEEIAIFYGMNGYQNKRGGKVTTQYRYLAYEGPSGWALPHFNDVHFCGLPFYVSIAATPHLFVFVLSCRNEEGQTLHVPIKKHFRLSDIAGRIEALLAIMNLIPVFVGFEAILSLHAPHVPKWNTSVISVCGNVRCVFDKANSAGNCLLYGTNDYRWWEPRLSCVPYVALSMSKRSWIIRARSF